MRDSVLQAMRNVGLLNQNVMSASIGFAVFGVLLAIGVVNAPVSLAQSSSGGGKRLGFEVASIKPSRPGSVGISLLTDPSGRFTTENATLRMIITFGFGVRDFQVSGGPSWIDSDRFDIVAKPEARANRAQVLQMVQTLLEDRFKLKSHRGTKELPVFGLVIGKNGPKLKPTKPEEDAARPMKGFQGGRGELTGLGADMGALATRLSAVLGRKVIDRTGLTGKYDFKLQWTPDTPQPMRNPDEPVTDNAPGPSLINAVQEQLGLRLEAQKGPVEILVIDSVEKPSAN